jgi:hypothetical protein
MLSVLRMRFRQPIKEDPGHYSQIVKTRDQTNRLPVEDRSTLVNNNEGQQDQGDGQYRDPRSFDRAAPGTPVDQESPYPR